MAAKIDIIRTELQGLIPQGANMLEAGQKEDFDLVQLALDYESWYTKALAAISQVAPERKGAFIDAYKREKRRDISAESYTISDYLGGLSVTLGGRPTFSARSSFAAKLLRQIAIVKAASELAGSALRDIRGELLAEILDADVDSARELAKANHLRSAGAVCGVALEAHFASILERRGLKLAKKHPTISDYNDSLKEAKAYDVPMWRLIQRLGDIRNLCAHSKERAPTKDEVNDLITGTDKVLKEVF